MPYFVLVALVWRMDCIAGWRPEGAVWRLVVMPRQVVMRPGPREVASGVGRKT